MFKQIQNILNPLVTGATDFLTWLFYSVAIIAIIITGVRAVGSQDVEKKKYNAQAFYWIAGLTLVTLIIRFVVVPYLVDMF